MEMKEKIKKKEAEMLSKKLNELALRIVLSILSPKSISSRITQLCAV